MWFHRKKNDRKTEERIQAIHEDTFKKIDKVTASIDQNVATLERVNELLKDRDKLGITGMIFYATGGLDRDGRIKDRKVNKK